MWRKLVDKVSAPLAFFPPPSPSYHLVERSNGRRKMSWSDSSLPQFEHTVYTVKTHPTRVGKHGSTNELIVVHIPCRSATHTLLCSHGNAVDVGLMMHLYWEMSRLLRVNVVGYDYSGYGRSTGQPTPSQTLSDLEAVYEWLIKEQGVPGSKIILYGQSVGSGPTAWLAAHEPGLAGVVLHSPLLSGMRVLKPDLGWWPAWADVFPNHTLAPRIQAPTLVMHGTEDEVIHISCGKRLVALLKNPFRPLWAEGFNHQNLEACPEFVPRLQDFIKHVREPPTPEPTT